MYGGPQTIPSVRAGTAWAQQYAAQAATAPSGESTAVERWAAAGLAASLSGPAWRLPQWPLRTAMDTGAIRGTTPAPVVVSAGNGRIQGRPQMPRLRGGQVTPQPPGWRKFYHLGPAGRA